MTVKEQLVTTASRCEDDIEAFVLICINKDKSTSTYAERATLRLIGAMEVSKFELVARMASCEDVPR